MLLKARVFVLDLENCVSEEWLGPCCLYLKEVAVHDGRKVLMELDDNSEWIVSNT